MRDLAVDPPPLLDDDQKRVKFINENGSSFISFLLLILKTTIRYWLFEMFWFLGLIKDLKSYVNERKMINVWTEKEKEIFKEKWVLLQSLPVHLLPFLLLLLLFLIVVFVVVFVVVVVVVVFVVVGGGGIGVAALCCCQCFSRPVVRHFWKF